MWVGGGGGQVFSLCQQLTWMVLAAAICHWPSSAHCCAMAILFCTTKAQHSVPRCTVLKKKSSSCSYTSPDSVFSTTYSRQRFRPGYHNHGLYLQRYLPCYISYTVSCTGIGGQVGLKLWFKWMEEYMDGWTDGRMDLWIGWTDEQTSE